MRLIRSVIAIAVISVAVTGISTAQEKGKGKGTLPQGWGKLGLSEEQKTKIYDIHGKHQAKIEDLRKQIRDEEDKMHKEQLAVLTPEQKAKLKEAMEKKLDDGEKKK